jgi:hypothetical protein
LKVDAVLMFARRGGRDLWRDPGAVLNFFGSLFHFMSTSIAPFRLHRAGQDWQPIGADSVVIKHHGPLDEGAMRLDGEKAATALLTVAIIGVGPACVALVLLL